MSLYKLVLKGTLDPSEVQPYHELELSLPGAEQAAEASEEQVEADVPEALEYDTLAPLLCLTTAQERAAEILAEARRQAETIRQEACEEGRGRGHEDGKKEILPALISFAQAGQSLIVFEEQMVTRFTSQMVRLSLEIAEKIVGKTIAEDPEIVASVLERAKKEVSDAKWVRVKLHPADYEVLAELRPELVRTGEEGGRKIEVSPSGEVARGGCRIETDIGVVDATIPTQVEEIKRQLIDE